MENYLLLQDVNYFGKTIKKGTIYRKYSSTRDEFRCFTTDGLECPHFDITFMIVRNNTEYFVKLNDNALSAAFDIVFKEHIE